MPFTPTQKRAAIWSLIALLALWALRALGPVLTPFVVGAVLAYALTPLVDRLDQVGSGQVPRFVSVVLVELLFLVVLLSLFLMVVPILAKEIPLMREQVPVLFKWLDGSVRPWLAQFGIDVALDLQSLKSQVLRYLQANYEEAVNSLMSSLKIGGSVAFAVVFNAVLIPVALFYLLLDWDRFVHRVLELVPPRVRPAVDSFTHEADQVLGSTCAGSCW